MSAGDAGGPWQRWAQRTACGAAACLGVHQLAGWPRPPVLLFDLVCVVGAPAWMWLCWRGGVRAPLRQPLLRAWLALAATWCLAASIGLPPGGAMLANLVKGVQAAVVVLGLAGVVQVGGAGPLLQAWLAGTLVCLAVGFAGYIGALLGFEALAYTDPHPVFSGVPRMVGLFGDSPQHFGEYLVLSLGVAHAASSARWPRLSQAVRRAGWPGLALTFSSAWVGGWTLLLGSDAVARRLPSGRLRAGLAFAGALAATWLMTFSVPLGGGPAHGSFDELDYAHFVIECGADRQHCERRTRRVPYAAPLTPYRLSKEQAIAAAREHFPWGLGPGGFEAYARGRLEGQRVPAFYIAPHSTYLGALAELGLPGLLALVYFCAALALRRHPPALHAVWLSVVGLMLIGLNIDVLRQRHLWVAVALLVGTREERSAVA